MISHIIRVCLPVLVLVAFSFTTADASLADGDVRYEDGLVTVKVHELNAMELLDLISREADIRIFIFDEFIPQRISLDIKKRPLEHFIRSVLNGHSFAVLYFSGEFSGKVVNFDSDRPGTEISGRLMREQEKRPEKMSTVSDGEDVPSRLSVPESGEPGQMSQGGVFFWHKRERSWSVQEDPWSAFGAAGQGEFSAEESDVVAATANPAETGYEKTGIPTPVQFPDTSGLSGAEELQLRIEYLKRRIASGESDAFYNKWEPIKGKYVTHDKVLLEHYEEGLRNLNT